MPPSPSICPLSQCPSVLHPPFPLFVPIPPPFFFPASPPHPARLPRQRMLLGLPLGCRGDGASVP